METPHNINEEDKDNPLNDDEIVLNQWLAEDLQAKPGDALTLVYFDPESGARLTERTNTFRVHSIVPMQMPSSCVSPSEPRASRLRSPV